MQKTIAFFDFDGTITRKDSMIEFIRFAKGDGAYYKSLAALSPWLIGMKLGLVPNARAKERMLEWFFKGMKLDEFNSLCHKFYKSRLAQLIRPDAMEAINEHKNKGHEVVVVSASAENWIIDWCKEQRVAYIATKLAVDSNNKITGKISGANCNGLEKVNRIRLAYDPAQYKEIWCYGDSGGDRSMLEIATHPHYRLFKK